MKTNESSPLFDYRTLRMIVGAIAFSIPGVVFYITATVTTSISASYHTDARDYFVGFLFIIGALLMAYKGHTPELHPDQVGGFWQRVGGFLNRVSRIWYGKKDYRILGRKYEEDLVSTIGGLASLIAALQPTACDLCVPDNASRIHGFAAITLFSAVVYFCLVAFLRSVIFKLGTGKNSNISFRSIIAVARMKIHRKLSVSFRRKLRRLRIYLFCGILIAVILAGFLIVSVILPDQTKTLKLTFWVETVALWLFGFAWMEASQLHIIRGLRVMTRRYVRRSSWQGWVGSLRGKTTGTVHE